jgi:hypothetical protein
VRTFPAAALAAWADTLSFLESGATPMDVFVTRHGETAWKMFDDYLQEFAMRSGEPFHPFDIDTNYRLYIDGKPRFDGARDFLNSRGLPPQVETVCGLRDRKTDLLNKVIEAVGLEPYGGRSASSTISAMMVSRLRS